MMKFVVVFCVIFTSCFAPLSIRENANWYQHNGVYVKKNGKTYHKAEQVQILYYQSIKNKFTSKDTVFIEFYDNQKIFTVTVINWP